MTLRAITPIVVVFTGLVVIASPEGAVAGQNRSVVSRHPLGIAFFSRFMTHFDEAGAMAIVKFQTDLVERTNLETGKKRLRSASGIYLPEEGKENSRMHIQGTFSLVNGLRGKIPSLGNVKEFVSIENGGPRDKKYLNLSPLLGADENRKSIVLLALWHKKATSVLDAQFIGPLAEIDTVDIKEFVEVLEKEPYATMNNNKAGSLLVSANPWLATLGLVRLEQLQELSFKHFARAIISTPSTATERLADDMIWFADRLDNWTGLAKELGELMPLIESPKQIQVLLRVESFWTLNPDQKRNPMQIADFQRALSEYRQEIANNPERRDVRERIDSLLSFGQNKK